MYVLLFDNFERNGGDTQNETLSVGKAKRARQYIDA